MATWADVDAVMAGLEDVTEGEPHGRRTWLVNGRAFAWDRPYSKADLKRFGAVPPAAEPILALATADLHEKEAILASGVNGVFTIEHFNGYKAFLVELDAVAKRPLRTLVTDAYRSQRDKTR